MPPQLTQVARLSDGMPLVATVTASPGVSVTSKQQSEAKDILRSLTHQWVKIMLFLVYYMLRLLLCSPDNLTCMYAYRSPTKMAVGSGNHVFYYMVRDTLCFLTMTESSYPKRTAFLYLDEIADIILGELVNEFGKEVRSTREIIQVVLWIHSLAHPTFSLLQNSHVSGAPRWTLQPAHFDSSITTQWSKENKENFESQSLNKTIANWTKTCRRSKTSWRRTSMKFWIVVKSWITSPTFLRNFSKRARISSGVQRN